MTVVMECRRVLGLQVIVVLVTILAQPSHTLVVVIWGAHGRCFRCAWAPAPSPEFVYSAQQHLLYLERKVSSFLGVLFPPRLCLSLQNSLQHLLSVERSLQEQFHYPSTRRYFQY
jgi:hypothetical protein